MSTGSIEYRWSKMLSNSDVNRNEKHSRNLLSFAKGSIMKDIDDVRNKMMGNENWQQENTSGQPSECVEIKFDVQLPKLPTETHILKVWHVPHREAGQNNYTTSLQWNPALSSRLRANDYSQHWCIIDKSASGNYSLTITDKEPTPRSIGFLD